MLGCNQAKELSEEVELEEFDVFQESEHNRQLAGQRYGLEAA